ncbi:MAG TPA: Y-family DNA polymerase [Ferruginibacter sp.]|nr:Y-family DNA polymerase [Ferruginibacter sp.]HQY42421.1 Y-family DNA polymerase [Ferruginibacter sp.]
MKAIIDCNSFYAACERVFNPSLNGKPVVVLSNNDGCIVSRTDEAKALGIKMAGPYYEAKEMLEQHKVAVFSSNYHLYGDMSWRVMETLRMLCQHVEVYSVDEAFADLKGIQESAMWNYGLHISNTVEQWTGIPVSVGIAATKTLAKVANHLAKKNKVATQGTVALLTPGQIREALENTAVQNVWGVGFRSTEKLRWLGIDTAWKLRSMSEEWAHKNLGGVVGTRLIKELNGISCIEMKDPLRKKKMIATTRMFGKPVFELAQLKEAIATYTSRAAEKLRRQSGAARLIHVFVVTNDYSAHNYNYNPSTKGLYTTLPIATSLTNQLIAHAIMLIEKLYKKGSRYLKAGVMLTDIVPDTSIQYNLFEPPAHDNLRSLMHAIDNINFGMRDELVKFATSGTKKNWKMRQEHRSLRHTTRWDELYEIH